MSEPLIGQSLIFDDAQTLADLATLVQRAKRIEAQGGIRLVGHGSLLVAYVAALHGVGLPTVLGMRVARLAVPSTVDVTVELRALTDRFARAEPGAVALPLPPAQMAGVRWAGVSPPRSGWDPVAEVSVAQARELAVSGIVAVAGASPVETVGMRSQIWGRDWADAGGAPAGLTFGAETLGFLPAATLPGAALPAEETERAAHRPAPLTVHRQGSWWRLTTPRGYVLARQSLLG